MIPLVSILFWIASLLLIASATLVVSLRNPVHSVLFLIFGFFNAAVLFILIEAEFLAMLLIVVYVGAVAVLFLFVVMMLDVSQETIKSKVKRNFPLGITLGGVVFMELLFVFSQLENLPNEIAKTASNSADLSLNNTEALGSLLYTTYFYQFQLAGLILLVAMIGAITLTIRHRNDVKRQSINNQVNRHSRNEITMTKI